ncbi:hypothetical protein ACMFMG_008748 [Clarireedia jacksonii]
MKSASMVSPVTVAFRYASLIAGISLLNRLDRLNDCFSWVYALAAGIVYIMVLPYIIVWRVFTGIFGLILGLVGIGNQSGHTVRLRERTADNPGHQSLGEHLFREVMIDGPQSSSRSPHPKTPSKKVEKINNKSITTPNTRSTGAAERYQESLISQNCCNQESRFGSVNMFEVLGDMEENTNTPRSTAARKLLDGSTKLSPRFEEAERPTKSNRNACGSSRKRAKRHRKSITALFHHPSPKAMALQQTSAQSDPFLSYPVKTSPKNSQGLTSNHPMPSCQPPRLSNVANDLSGVKRQAKSGGTESRQKQTKATFTSDNPSDHTSKADCDKHIVTGREPIPSSKDISVSDGSVIFTNVSSSDDPTTSPEADPSSRLFNPEELQRTHGTLPNSDKIYESTAPVPESIATSKIVSKHRITERAGPTLHRPGHEDSLGTSYTSRLPRGSSKSSIKSEVEDKTNVRPTTVSGKLIQRKGELVGWSRVTPAAVLVQRNASNPDECGTPPSEISDHDNSQNDQVLVNVEATKQAHHTPSIAQHPMKALQSSSIVEGRPSVRQAQMASGSISIGSPVSPASS